MIYEFGPFQMDLDRFEVRRGSDPIELSPKAFEVLRTLLESPDRTVAKQELLDAIWPGVAVTEAVLSQAVHTARRALESDTEIIQTVRGRGYRMGVAVEADERTEDAAQPAIPVSPPAARPLWRRRPVLTGCSVAVLPLLMWLAWLGRAPSPTAPPVGRSLLRANASPRTVAVLPFADMSVDGVHAHLADGISEEIINALAQLPELRVAARTSAFAFRGRSDDVRAIASELGVGTVLEGSVRVAGSRIRVTAQLIEAASGFHMWSEVYERELEDLFFVQGDIAEAIRKALEVQLVGSWPTPARPASFDAYQAYLRGRAAYFMRTKRGFDEALCLFERSLAIDRNYAPAWAGISDVHRGIYATWLTETRGGPTLAAAEQAARKASELAPKSAEAHTALANLYNVRYRDWARAEAAYLEAIRLSSGWPDAHLFYASLLMKRGRLAEAKHHLDRTLELDPLSSYAHRQRGRVAYYTGDLDEAIAYLRRGLELNARDVDAPRLLWSAYLAKGMEAEGNEAYLRVLPEWQKPGVRIATRLFGARWVIARFTDLAEWIQSRQTEHIERSGWERSGAWGIALALAWLGDEERMHEALERSADHGLGYIVVEPVFDAYRNDPRFIDLLNRSGYGP